MTKKYTKTAEYLRKWKKTLGYNGKRTFRYTTVCVFKSTIHTVGLIICTLRQQALYICSITRQLIRSRRL